jgi:hypothetical protein
MSLVAASPWGLVSRWSAGSQEMARRNAMAACTELTARRLERLDVEAFIADFLARRAAAAAPQPVAGMAGVG